MRLPGGPTDAVETITIIEAYGSHHGHLYAQAKTGAFAQVREIGLTKAVPGVALVEES